MLGEARVVHGFHVGMGGESPRELALRLRPAAAARTCRVRRPRSSSHAGSGARTPPIVLRTQTRCSRRSTSRVVIRPASASEWPARYFVALCHAKKSAPRSRGRWRRGVANVLSQHRSAPPAWAAATTTAMSVTASVGFDGVSMIASAAAVAGTAEALGVAQVVAAHVDAEAGEHLRAQQLDLVVAARRDHERLALPEQARDRDKVQAVMPLANRRRLGILERAQQRFRFRGDGRVSAAVRRAAARLRARTSSSGRALARAPAKRCRRGRGRVESRAPWPEAFHSGAGVCAGMFTEDITSRIARVRSAQRSSTSSSPTERRSRPSGTRPGGSMRARHSISVSMPPRLVAQRASRAESSQRRALGAVGGLEGQHAAGPARHLTLSELVIGMPGEAWIVDGVDRGVGGQSARELARGCGLALKPHLQRAQAAQQQPGGVGREHAAEQAAGELEVVAEGRRYESRRRRPGRRSDRRGTSWRSARTGRRRGRGGAAGAASRRCCRSTGARLRRARPRAARARSVSVSRGFDGVSMSARVAPSQARWKAWGRGRRSSETRRRSAPGTRSRIPRGCSSRSSAEPGRCLRQQRQADARPGSHAAGEDGRIGVLERFPAGLRPRSPRASCRPSGSVLSMFAMHPRRSHPPPRASFEPRAPSVFSPAKAASMCAAFSTACPKISHTPWRSRA